MFPLLLLALGWIAGCADSPPVVPNMIGGMTRSSMIAGEAAQEVLNRLHGKMLTPEKSIVGRYETAGRSAVLYVSVYPSPAGAKEAETRMAALIDRGGASFSPTQEMVIQGKSMFVCSGIEQIHFFFSAQAHLYWLAADGMVAHRAVADLVDALETR